VTATVAVLSDRQQALRATGLGASEVPTALGLNPFMAAAELAAVKRGEMEPSVAGEAAAWGQRFERPIADEWIARRRAEGHAWAIFTPGTLRHPTCPVLLASPDRIVVPDGRRARSEWVKGLEIKNLSFFRGHEFGDEADAIPEHILVQVQVQLEVTGLDASGLGAVLGGQRYIERDILRDREMGRMLVEFATKWWADHVVQGLPVPVDGSEASTTYLRRRYPVDSLPPMPATQEAAELVAAVRAAKAALKAAEATETEATNRLRALLGPAAGVEGLCTYRANKPSNKVDWEEVARFVAVGEPDLLKTATDRFTTTKPGARVLRLSKE